MQFEFLLIVSKYSFAVSIFLPGGLNYQFDRKNIWTFRGQQLLEKIIQIQNIVEDFHFNQNWLVSRYEDIAGEQSQGIIIIHKALVGIFGGSFL